jgi:molecular chaperone HtpG
LKKSPNLEIFRRRGLEVLYLTDPIDEFVLSTLDTFDGHKLVSIYAADVELPEEPKGEPSADATASGQPPTAAGVARVFTLFKDVRESKRLTDSSCCLVNAEGGLSVQMQRLLRIANKDFPATARILEVNPSAPLVRRLAGLSANADHDGFIKRCALQLWSNALLLEGAVVEPEAMVARNQSFMEEAAERRSPIIV